MIVPADSSFVVIVIAIHIAAAMLGLTASAIITYLACKRLVFGEPVLDVALVRQLHGLGVLALCMVLGSSATLFILWMELYCIPGEEPMIFRLDFTRLPSKTVAKLLLVVPLAACALAVDRYPLLNAQTASLIRTRPASLRDMLELGAYASAPFVCWLAIAGIALVPALQSWSASSLLAATAATWLIVMAAMLLIRLGDEVRSQSRRSQAWLSRTAAATGIPNRGCRSASYGAGHSDSFVLFDLKDLDVGQLTAVVVHDPDTGEDRPLIRLVLPPSADDVGKPSSIIWRTRAEFIVETDPTGAQVRADGSHRPMGASNDEDLRYDAA